MRISGWSSDVCSSDLRLAIESATGDLGGQDQIYCLQLAILEAERTLLGVVGDIAAELHTLLAVRNRLAAEARIQRQRIEIEDLRRKRSEEHTSELQSLMRISYAVFCLKKKNNTNRIRQRLNDANQYT